MSKNAWLWIGGIAAVFLLFTVTSYNGLVSTEERADTAAAQIETQTQRRFDLIPQLVESVKGAMTQERTVFENLAAARASYAGAAPEGKAAAAAQVESAFGRLLAVMENYPDLKSSDAVRDLMAQLEGTENRISVARQRFNEAIQEFNLKVRRFPSSIVAGIFGFEEKEKFAAKEAAAEPVEVDLSL